MRNLVIRILVNAVALWAAAQVVGGIALSESLGDILWVALVFGLVNAVLKPIVMLLAFPVLFLTLGLFTLIINAGLLLLTSALTDALAVDGFIPAFVGSIVISVVSMVLAWILTDEKKK